MNGTVLNLLPPDIQSQRRAIGRYELITRLLRIPTIAVIALLLLGQGVLMVMEQHSDSLTADAAHAREQAAATPSADVTKLTVQVNNQIAMLKKTLGTARPLHTPTVAILNAMPKGVSITKLTIETTGVVRIEGIASTRSTFLQLQDVMKTLSVLKNATTTSTASKREQLPFIYTAKLVTP